MKVILTEDVEKLGNANEIVEVADGYARNFLVPRSLAVPATASALANIDNMKRVHDRRQTRLRGAAEQLGTQLTGKTIVMPAKIGAGGRLYGSIGTQDIAAELQSQLGVEIERKQILLEEPIRQTGVYTVPLALHRDVRVDLLVQVGDAPVEVPAQAEAVTA
jgi:large subunit ribosomal protein L9